MADMDNKVLVNVAPVSAEDKVIIPEKIAEDVYKCYKAGAAMVHLHVRDREGRLTPDMSLLEETLAMIAGIRTSSSRCPRAGCRT